MDNDQKFEIIFKRSSKISSRSKEIIVMAYREKEEEKKASLIISVELNQHIWEVHTEVLKRFITSIVLEVSSPMLSKKLCLTFFQKCS